MRFGKVALAPEQGKPSTLLESFKQDLAEGLEQIAESCAPEVAAADGAATALQKLHDNVIELQARQTDKQQHGDRLRAEISQALSDGKDVAGLVRSRAEILAEVEVLKDLISDIQDVRIPTAEKAHRDAAAKAAGKLKHEIVVLRNALQRRHIDQVLFMMADMAKLHRERLKEFSMKYPSAQTADMYVVQPPKPSLILPDA